MLQSGGLSGKCCSQGDSMVRVVLQSGGFSGKCCSQGGLGGKCCFQED